MVEILPVNSRNPNFLGQISEIGGMFDFLLSSVLVGWENRHVNYSDCTKKGFANEFLPQNGLAARVPIAYE